MNRKTKKNICGQKNELKLHIFITMLKSQVLQGLCLHSISVELRYFQSKNI